MPRGRAKPKAVDTPYFSLERPEDLLELQKEMLKNGYSGTLMSHKDNGSDKWNLQLQVVEGELTAGPRAELRPSFTAELGQVVLWDGTTLSQVTPDEFRERWNV